MPKPHTFPTLFDECKILSITSLKKMGLLMINRTVTTELTFKTNGQKSGTIGVSINMGFEPYGITLNYVLNNQKHINYKVQFVSVPSNLGKGVVWYFLCPKTGKRCRKLYFIDSMFLHRSAFKGCMYEKQTYSSGHRKLFASLINETMMEDAFMELRKKHFRKTYKGNLTKRYLRLLRITGQCQISLFSGFIEKKLTG